MKQGFLLQERKIISCRATLRETNLASKKVVDVKNLQRFPGKCISFSLTMPGVKLLIISINAAIV